MLSDGVVAAICVLMFAMGFMSGGIVYGTTPFWDGVRSFYRSFVFWR